MKKLFFSKKKKNMIRGIRDTVMCNNVQGTLYCLNQQETSGFRFCTGTKYQQQPSEIHLRVNCRHDSRKTKTLYIQAYREQIQFKDRQEISVS
jgi:hypothetical protein